MSAAATGRLSVLFVCMKNGGRSQMAGALMRLEADGQVDVHTVGTHPVSTLSAQSAEVLAEVPGMRAPMETWETDEPSTRGIDGIERMRLVRDDIRERVRVLRSELDAGRRQP